MRGDRHGTGLRSGESRDRTTRTRPAETIQLTPTNHTHTLRDQCAWPPRPLEHVSMPTSTRTGHTSYNETTRDQTYSARTQSYAHPAQPAGYIPVPHTHPARARPSWPPSSPPSSPPRASLRASMPPPMPPPMPPLEPPPPLLPPPPPEAAAQLPAEVLEDVGWLAPQKRRLDVRNHRSWQPARGRWP